MKYSMSVRDCTIATVGPFFMNSMVSSCRHVQKPTVATVGPFFMDSFMFVRDCGSPRGYMNIDEL